MNKSRRTRLNDAIIYINRAMALVQEVAEEEQDSFDNLPEGIQESDRGTDMEENIGELEQVTEELETQVEVIQEIIER